MREIFNMFFRLAWAMPLMFLRQIAGMLSPDGIQEPGRGSSAHIPNATDAPQDQSTYQTGRQPQTQTINPASAADNSTTATTAPFENLSSPVSFSVQASSGKLDTSRMVALGEGLAAGMGDFSLNSEMQPWSFPAQMARQMFAEFPQRLLQPPGIGNLAGFASLPVRVPAPLQTTVLDALPPNPVFNLSVPEFRLDDALELRPKQPLVHRNDSRQTAVNLIWGVLPIAQGQHLLPTQVDHAIQLSPTFIVIELGFYEAVEAAVNGNPDLLPEADFFISRYRELLSRLRQCGAEILALNIPDPLDTAHFASLDTAAGLLRVDPACLAHTWSLNASDLLTLRGFNEIGYQLFAKNIQPLPQQSSLSAGIAQTISNKVSAINQQLATAAAEHHVVLFDLASLIRGVARDGWQAGTRRLGGHYLEGFYSLNGYYPGRTGQAIIANEVLRTLNQTYGVSFPPIDLSTVANSDPVAGYHRPSGPLWSRHDLEQMCHQNGPSENGDNVISSSCSTNGWTPFANAPESGLPLQLPVGLEQVLPLSKNASYFGDGISPVNTSDARGVQWGSTGNWLFGGLALVDSHLRGSIRIKFSPPVDDITQFQIDFVGGFSGEDSELVAPQFFRMAFRQNRVDEVPGTVSSGTLNLATGEVSNLTIYAGYKSIALQTLVGINPSFPKQPLSFPGQYGSAWAQFEQRQDGKLDFSFYGSTFVPLGKDIVWPLNFVGPSGEIATIPAAGTVMHPHLSLSTKSPVTSGNPACPQIEFNSLQEFTLFTHNSAFGDAFSLKVPHLGGPAKGRSHLLGRLQIQFGPRCGNSVPFAAWALPPGGIMAPLGDSPITEIFPGRLSPGPQGFNENLRFPLRTYPLDDLSIIDDPFDICVGAIDLTTGRSLNDILHRAFISQDLIFALLRVEPRTPKDSFFFRGPALLLRDNHEQNVLRFQGIVHIPYPPGFKFPHPDFTTAFIVGGNSALDPFLWFHAIQAEESCGILKEGESKHVRSSTGDEFSYRYRIPVDPHNEKVLFEYENHTQQGSFRMHSLAWIDFSNSGTANDEDHAYDTVTFSGFGVWSKDNVQTLQQVAVQISTSSEKPYVGIQVAAGDVSNVNTKPAIELTALP